MDLNSDLPEEAVDNIRDALADLAIVYGTERARQLVVAIALMAQIEEGEEEKEN